MPISAEACTIWVWTLDQPPEATERLRRHLSRAELDRAARFLDPRHGGHFVVAHGVLREILGAILRSAPDQLNFELGTFGKPFLAGDQNSTLHFNLSHSSFGQRSLGALAVSRHGEIGVDIEAIRPIDPSISESFAPEEQRLIDSIDGENRIDAFYRVWTLKEAALKASGAGLSSGADIICVDPDGENPRVKWTSGGLPDAGRFQLKTFESAPGFAGAVAVLDTPFTLRVDVRQFDNSVF